MVSVIKRMRTLKTLLEVRLGMGAAILSPEVKRIHMSFAHKINDGHMGPRKFWRRCLPRLKYHNPSVAMTVDRTTDQSGPATLTLFLSTPTASSAPAPEGKEESRTLDIKSKTDTEIWNAVLSTVAAREIVPTPEEREELARLEEEARRAERDRVEMAALVAKRKREKEVLERARRSVEGL